MELPNIPPTLYVLVSLAGAAVILSWRFRETSSPVNSRTLLIPPIAMSTGLFMFIAPQTRVPWSWAAIALALGAGVFAWPLMRSSTLERSGDQFVMRRSPAFLWILLGLLAMRFALRAYVEQYVTQYQTGALFFLLAFGAIVRWRAQLFFRLRTLRAGSSPGAP